MDTCMTFQSYAQRLQELDAEARRIGFAAKCAMLDTLRQIVRETEGLDSLAWQQGVYYEKGAYSYYIGSDEDSILVNSEPAEDLGALEADEGACERFWAAAKEASAVLNSVPWQFLKDWFDDGEGAMVTVAADGVEVTEYEVA